MPESLDALRAHLATVQDLRHAAAVLDWDQETYMPPGGADGRAHQSATLRRVAHERFASDETARLLDAAEPETAGRALEDPDAALVRVTRRDLARATRLPGDHVAAFAEATARAKTAWAAAREADDFAAFAPHLARIVGLRIEAADLLRPVLAEERGPGYAPSAADARYDALLDEFEPGAQTADVAAVFADLQAELVPLVAAIGAADQVPDAPVRGAFAESAQWAFGVEIARAFGYDMARGRQDRSAHPFTTSFGADDVRITTRLDPAFFPTAFFGTLHEVGHALYEQGFAPELARSPLADGASLGLHESQSRLWENQVGRSRAFWQRHAADARRHFPDALGGTEPDAIWRAVNRVAPSLIRVEADELTYHLHVLLRFEIERALVAEVIAAEDVPEAWNSGMEDLLGIAPASDADGCLQDIHWSLGALGYFPTYSLGTLLSAQLWDAIGRDLGDPDALVAAGEYGQILAWLRDRVHRWGRTLPAHEIVRRAAGTGLDAAPWVAYARAKFADVYGL